MAYRRIIATIYRIVAIHISIDTIVSETEIAKYPARIDEQLRRSFPDDHLCFVTIECERSLRWGQCHLAVHGDRSEDDTFCLTRLGLRICTVDIQ